MRVSHEFKYKCCSAVLLCFYATLVNKDKTYWTVEFNKLLANITDLRKTTELLEGKVTALINEKKSLRGQW